MQAQIKIPIPTQRRVLTDGKGMLNCSEAQENLWQLNTKDMQEIPKFQKVQMIQNPKVKFGRITSKNHQTAYFTWRRSSRSYERFLIGNRPRCEHSNLAYNHVCHTSSCSSSWTTLFVELPIRQESILEVCGALSSDN